MENIKDIINNFKLKKLENYVPKKIDFNKINKELNELRIQEINKMFQKRKKEIGNFTWDNFKTKIYREKESEIIKIKNACIKFCEKINEMQKGLYLASAISGTGKTFMTKIIANNLLDKQKMVKFITCMDLIKKVKEEIVERTNIIDILKDVTILIVDDISNLKFTEFEQGIIFEVLDYRKNNKKITIATANAKIVDLNVSEKLKTRFFESFYEINFPEVSIRKLKAEREDKQMEEVLFN